MIASLQGRISAKGDSYLVLDVGGVGFKVFVPPALLDGPPSTGQQLGLFTHMHVRENELSLYGFSAADELTLFELLLHVSGIGPKVAMKIVSMMPPDALREAIARGDAAALTRVPGVGKRIAERVLVDLKDKLGVSRGISYPALSGADAEVISALTSLGYSVSEAQAALRSLPQKDLALEERIRSALQHLAKP
jgi:Holliday junction DNA helicase RuvA